MLIWLVVHVLHSCKYGTGKRIKEAIKLLRLIVLKLIKNSMTGGSIMSVLLTAGETVRHKKRKEWGVGKIVDVNRCGTIRVIFKEKGPVSIARGSDFLTRIPQDKTRNSSKH
jgi:hypothetical protein